MGEELKRSIKDLPEPMELKQDVVKTKNKSKSNSKSSKKESTKKNNKKESDVEGYKGNESLEDLVIKSIKWSYCPSCSTKFLLKRYTF